MYAKLVKQIGLEPQIRGQTLHLQVVEVGPAVEDG